MKKHGKKQKQKAKLRGSSGPGQQVITLERRPIADHPRQPNQMPTVQLPTVPRAGAAIYAAPPAYSHDDRIALSLLMLPFLILAFAIGSSQVWRNRQQVSGAIVHRIPAPLPAPFARPTSPIAADTAVVVATAPRVPNVVETRGSNGAVVQEARPPVAVAIAPVMSAWPVVSARAPGPRMTWPVVAAAAPDSPPQTATPPSVTVASTAAPIASLAPSNSAVPLAPSAATGPEILALLVPEPATPAAPAPVTAPAKPDVPENSCVRDVAIKRTPGFFLGDAVNATAIDAGTFGRALATAAREQLDDFTVYTDKYQTLKYPMGDLPAFYGVCTDVIVRAYRELGVDLQELVHVSKLGGGDSNIDHRRVTTLQKFFAKFGDDLPITEFGEDYLPGDIVSYYRPQNAHSRTHIAVVSDVVGPSGQLMIIHNRGWGPQIEDGLFVDQITGHYRYSGAQKPAPAPAAVASRTKKAVPTAASQPGQVKKVKRAVVPGRDTQGASLASPLSGSFQR